MEKPIKVEVLQHGEIDTHRFEDVKKASSFISELRKELEDIAVQESSRIRYIMLEEVVICDHTI